MDYLSRAGAVIHTLQEWEPGAWRLRQKKNKYEKEKEKGRTEKEKKGLFFNFQISNRLLFFI